MADLTVDGNVFSGQTGAGIQFTQDNVHFIADLSLVNNFIRTSLRGGMGIHLPAHSTAEGNWNAEIMGNIVNAYGHGLRIWSGMRNA